MKKICSAQGWTLILYNLLMTVAVIAVFYAGYFAASFLMSFTNGGYDPDAMIEAAMNSGWGYWITIFIGVMILLIWKKPKYFSHTNAPEN